MPPEHKPISPSTAYAVSTLAAAFWAGNFVIGRGIKDSIPPLTLAWAHWTGAALLILPFVCGYLRTDWNLMQVSMRGAGTAGAAT